MNIEEAKIRSDILKALANPIRVLLVDALSRGDKCVNELNELVDVDQSNISRHLAHLKKAGIVSERREGTKIVHHLACPCILQASECTLDVIRSDTKRRQGIIRKISK